MKAGIHPEYVESEVSCSCGATFTTRSTRPTLHVELCNECHPFYTGKQKLVDSGGRVERFRRRYAQAQSTPTGKKAKAARRAARRETEEAPAGTSTEASPASPTPPAEEAPEA